MIVLLTSFNDLGCRYQRDIRRNQRPVVFPPPKKLMLFIPKPPAQATPPAPAPPAAQYNPTDYNNYSPAPAPAPYPAPAPAKYNYNPEPAPAPHIAPAQVLAVFL